MRLRGIMPKERCAPPWSSSTLKLSGIPISSLVRAMASSWTASYSLARWLISITDMPVPAKSRSSAWARSRAGRGRPAGPA